MLLLGFPRQGGKEGTVVCRGLRGLNFPTGLQGESESLLFKRAHHYHGQVSLLFQ